MFRNAAVGIALGALALLTACGNASEEPPPEEQKEASASRATADESDPVPIADGSRLVFFGDSLAVTSPPNYPEMLPAALAEAGVRGTEVENVAEPGTTSEDWAPGSARFETTLRPALESADVVLVSVGGNDLEAAVGGTDGIDSVGTATASESAVDALRDANERIGRNLARTFRAIRRENRRALIVYVSYPDYAGATVWRERAGIAGSIALRAGLGSIIDRASEARPDIVVDMLTGTVEEDMDALLADGEHLSTAGHELYAEEIAAALSATGESGASSP